MVDHVLRNPSAVARYRRTPLGDGLDAFAGHLLARGHPRKVAAGYLRLGLHFAQWCQRSRLRASALSETDGDRFLVHLARGRCRCPPPIASDVESPRGVLRLLFEALRANGSIPAAPLAPTGSSDPLWQIVSDFLGHLERHQDLRPTVRWVYAREALMLLRWCFRRSTDLDWDRLTPLRLARYLTHRGRGLKPRSIHAIGTGLRSFLRYAALRGWLDADLTRAVPRPAIWTLADVPRSITDNQLAQLLSSFDRRSALGRRDRAMCLLMAQMGLRRAEVAHLRLEDLDWGAGVLRLARTKVRRGQQLPMPADVGRALVAYLQKGRPPSLTRTVFVTLRTPKGQALTPAGVGAAIRYGFERAGLASPFVPSTGTHVLRHTAATRMLADGATLKEIGDVLRHRSINTTALYAKVDLAKLRAVALPWPEFEVRG